MNIYIYKFQHFISNLYLCETHFSEQKMNIFNQNYKIKL